MSITTKEFLQMLYGKCTEGCITITTLPGAVNEHIPVTEPDKVAECIKVLGTHANPITVLHCVRRACRRVPEAASSRFTQSFAWWRM